jgi:hypothetical protein
VRNLKHWRGVVASLYAAEFLLPWVATGHRIRSAYNLAGVLHDTRIVPNRFVDAVVFCVLVMPVFAAITVAADVVGARRVAITTLLATSALVAACVVALRFTQLGPRLAAATVVLALGLSLRDVGGAVVVADQERRDDVAHDLGA